MNEKITNSIKLLCILCICFLILALFYYINKYNETFSSTTPQPLISIKPLISDMFSNNIYKSELECIDHLKVQALNLKDDPDLETPEAKQLLYKLNNDAKQFCENKCKPSICRYKDNLENVPDYIKTLHKKKIENKPDNPILVLSWLRPDSEHPILKYVCVIETETTEPVRVEIPIITDNDIIEHTINDLDENTNYTIKVFSENKFGVSKPSVLYNIKLSEIKDDNEDDYNEDTNNLNSILSQILMHIGSSDIKIDTTELQNKYNIKKQIILNYLLQNSNKLNKLSNNKNIKII